MKLTRLLKENQEEPKKISPQAKKHFLEIVSTYNKYQEMMDRKSDLAEIADTLGAITEAAKTLLLGESDDWFDKVTIKRNMSELDKLGSQFDKVAQEARMLDQRMNGLYEDMGHILSRYYKIGEISDDQMKERLGMRETEKEDDNHEVSESSAKPKKTISKQEWSKIAKYNKHIGMDGTKYIMQYSDKLGTYLQAVTVEGVDMNEAGEDVNKAVIPGDVKIKLQKALEVLNGKKLTYPQKLQVMGRVLDSLGIDKKELNKVSTKLRTKLESKVEEGMIQEENCPTDAGKWSYYKSQAKKKFDVYPSAYANGWAAKQYKAAGGGWKKCS